MDCFTLNFKLKYEDSENITADRVNTVVFNLHQIKRRAFFFWDTRYGVERLSAKRSKDLENGAPDAALVAVVECDTKSSKVCVYASYWETVTNLFEKIR